MKNQQVAQQAPRRPWKQCHEVRFDLLRIGFSGQSEALGDPTDVRVDDDADVDSEGIAEDDVGGLSCDAGEREKIGHGGWDVAAMSVGDQGHRTMQVLGLVPPEIEGFYVRLDVGGGCVRVVLRRRERLEESGRRLVHPDVGRLGTQNRRD